MTKTTRYLLIGLGIVLLALIRYFEDILFYDPYLQFFKNDYLYIDSPRQETLKLTANTLLRYSINSGISLGIIYLAFLDRSMVKFSFLVYTVALVLLLIAFLYFVINPKQEDYYLFFNVRRFLIQPLLLVLLVPAFYYYKLKR